MNWKKIGKRLLFTHPAFTAAFSLCSFALLIFSSLHLAPTHPLSIISYAMSFYALVLLCLRIPDIIRFARRFASENRYYLRYRTDVKLRMNLSLGISVLFNSAYGFFQFGLGLWHHSVWFYAMAGYYLLLAGLRLMLARSIRGHQPGEQRALEWRKYRLCGVGLLSITLVLTIFLLYFIFRVRSFAHHEITTIAMAVCTFTSMTMAIINVIRYQKYNSPSYSAAREISLASAAVSILTLENAMFTAFGPETDELFRQIMLAATGAAAMLLVILIAVSMIIRSSRALKVLENHYE